MNITKQSSSNPVLIVDLSIWYGGVDTRVFETALALHGEYQYSVMTINGSPIDKQLKKANLNTISLPFYRSDPRILFAIIRAVRKDGYKVIDTHNPQSQFWGTLAGWLTHVPLIISTVHSSYRETYKGLKGKLYGLVLCQNNLCKSRFVAVSESVYEYLQYLNIDDQRICLVHNGIQIANNNLQGNDGTLFDTLGWGKDNFILAVIGRLEQEKGHKYLIEALNMVVNKRPQIRCLIVGKGRLQNDLEIQVERAKLKKYIYFADFQKNVKALLHASNAFCMPSLTEGLPYALLEACSCRLPLLVTGVGGLKKLLTNNQTALIVPPANPSELAKGIIKLIDNPKDNIILGNAAFKLAQDNFSVEDMNAKTLAIYNDIAKQLAGNKVGS